MNNTLDNTKTMRELLLDSSLIVTANIKKYNLKIINCNSYIQVYFFQNTKIKKDENLELLKGKNDLNIKNINTDNLTKMENKKNKIDKKNINRSKLQCQRLAKCNANEWKSFITLTFEDNLKDIEHANKKFRVYITSIQRVYKDFKYICVPEFQKRGAVHYHLLTNIECNSELIPKRPQKKLYSPSFKTWKILDYYDLKYWNSGYSEADNVTGDIKKIVGYISKYMTKDVDNRLFNKHRYFYSRNLKKPTISYLDISDISHVEFLSNLLSEKELIYENNYIDSYTQEIIGFKEYLQNN